jgi:DNA-3-methyladenine glycosylase I
MSGYCDSAPGHEYHGPYHDTEYGFPTDDETVLFERLSMEIMQAGLSWLLILKKRAAMQKAFAGFAVDKVAKFGDKDLARLLADEGIIRNRLKINAIVENARRIQALRKSHGSFAAWIAEQHPLAKADWVKLFKKTFKFTGGEITGEFLMSIGYLPGAHRDSCPVQGKIARKKPAWMKAPPGTYA